MRPLLLAAVSCGAVLASASAAHSGVETAPLGSRARCERYSGVPAGFGRDPHAGMVWIAAGDFTPGSGHGYPEERGGELTHVAGFWIDRTEVTNAQFARFVAATGYVTTAERSGSSAVFRKPAADGGERDYAWWQATPGASWRHPGGPATTAAPHHPVVHVTQADALAYAAWLDHALPSEQQWEFAARAGQAPLEREPRDPSGQPTANFWQGDFPAHNTLEDGFETSAPVGCFAADAYGLFDMLGNVWEWTGSPYTSSHSQGDTTDDTTEHDGCTAPAHAGARLTLKGGSFLCAANFCARYRVAARHAQEADQPTMHIGFRTVRAR